MRPDQDRVSGLIVSTVIKLCEKGLDFSNSVTIQGVIGVTVDNKSTFVIHIDKTVTTNECGFDNSPSSASKVSSVNIQEPSSSNHRDGAVSVGSTGSSYSNNFVGGAQQPALVTNIKVENNHSVGYHEDASLHQNKNLCKMETTDASYNQAPNFNYNDEDTLDFKDVPSEMEIKNEFQDVKPVIYPGNVSGIIDIPSDTEDYNNFPQQINALKQQQNMNSQQQMTFPQQQQQRPKSSTNQQHQPRNPSAQFRMSPPMRQNVVRPAQNVPQLQPQMRGQFASSWGANSPPQSMALVPVQQVRPCQPFQTRQRVPHQVQPIRAPRSQQRPANPHKRMAAPSNAMGRGAGTGRGGRGGAKAVSQEIQCQSGDGFTFNKQLTVLSRFCCNLCGKVYKNQRSVLHHQSQVHGRPKTTRRKKSDSYEQDEAGYDDGSEYYEEGYGEEEAW